MVLEHTDISNALLCDNVNCVGITQMCSNNCSTEMTHQYATFQSPLFHDSSDQYAVQTHPETVQIQSTIV